MIRDARVRPQNRRPRGSADAAQAAAASVAPSRGSFQTATAAATAAATSTRLRATTTATGPRLERHDAPVQVGELDLRERDRDERQDAGHALPGRSLPTTTSATSGSVQQRNCGESTLLQTVKASTQASAATGMYSGAARSSARRRQMST